MKTRDPDGIREVVRERYAQAARSVTQSCCGPVESTPGLIGSTLYPETDLASLPGDALAASLGCGNPTLLADLHPGETVLDLGSGGGIDVLLSARRVGPAGKAYGLDMTPEMLDLARKNQSEAGITNAEFLFGTIEAVPLPDSSVDVIISNCVINLSANKDAVFAEAFRVLRPGGRLAVSDIVLRRELPDLVAELIALWTGCVAGALVDNLYRSKLERAGFHDVSVEPVNVFGESDLQRMAEGILGSVDVPDDFDLQGTIRDLNGVVTSSFVKARKPL